MFLKQSRYHLALIFSPVQVLLTTSQSSCQAASTSLRYAEREFRIFIRQTRKLVNGALEVNNPTILEFGSRARELAGKLAIEAA